MTTQNNSHVAKAATYLAECEDRARATQAALIEAQRRCVAATPVYRNAGECADLIAQAAAADAVNGTRTADILRERLICERADAEARFTEQRDAEVAAKEAGEQHAQAESYVRAARAGLEAAVQEEARKLAAKAVQKYGAALNALLAAHEEYLGAAALLNNGAVSGPDLLPPLPTFGAAGVASAFTAASATHIYFPIEPVMVDRANALRAQIVAGAGQVE
jgi:hypothetical protein